MNKRVTLTVIEMAMSVLDGRSSATTNKTSDGAVAQEELINPLVIESKDGVLRYKLTAKPDEISVGGKTFVSNFYNGSYAVRVLVVQQGDSIDLEFDNQIDKAFNFVMVRRIPICIIMVWG